MPVEIIPQDQMLQQVGKKFEPTPWITVDQERINTFAECTEDHQFIHVNEKKAAQTPLGGTIAHGFLSLSLLAKVFETTGIVPDNMVMGMNYGLNKVRFLSPVRAGKRIRGHVEILNIERKDDKRFLITQMVSIEIEGEKTPALIAESLLMTFVS
ncbi:MAG: MaoC family dehydratase [Porticoccaceae bacterium]|nr:MaoC family dehydratase [Porticoccaceae bacterium]